MARVDRALRLHGAQVTDEGGMSDWDQSAVSSGVGVRVPASCFQEARGGNAPPFRRRLELRGGLVNAERLETLGGLVKGDDGVGSEAQREVDRVDVWNEGELSSALRVGNELPGRDWGAGGRAGATLLGWGSGGGGELTAGAGAEAGTTAAAEGEAWGRRGGAGVGWTTGEMWEPGTQLSNRRGGASLS